MSKFFKHFRTDILVIFGPVCLLFLFSDFFVTIKMGFSHTTSILVLAFITLILMGGAWNVCAEYYEDLLRLSFDDNTIRRAHSLKNQKDLEAEQ